MSLPEPCQIRIGLHNKTCYLKLNSPADIDRLMFVNMQNQFTVLQSDVNISKYNTIDVLLRFCIDDVKNKNVFLRQSTFIYGEMIVKCIMICSENDFYYKLILFIIFLRKYLARKLIN